MRIEASRYLRQGAMPSAIEEFKITDPQRQRRLIAQLERR
jgi:hypothetical protein